MSNSILPSFPVFFDNSDQRLEGGYIYIGVPNQNPETTPQQAYWDKDLTQTADQPIRTVNGRPALNGSPRNVYVSGDYSITIRDSQSQLVYSVPEVPLVFGDVYTNNVQFDTVADLLADENTYSAGTYAQVKDGDFTYKVVSSGGDVQNSAATPVQFEVLPNENGYNIKAFGAAGDGVTDDTSKIQAALNKGGSSYLPAGNYLISSGLTYTDENQSLVGPEPFNAINVSTVTPSDNEFAAQILTSSAIDMLTMDQNGSVLKNIYFNGREVATNGVKVAPSNTPSLKFGIVIDNVFINDVVTCALDTGFAVDSMFERIMINGYHNSSASTTEQGIRNGATNNSFHGCWLHGCQNSVVAAGATANFVNCTFTNFPYNASTPHVFPETGSSLSLYTYTGCYFETNVPLVSNSTGVGSQVFSQCFIQNNNPSNLIDLTGATSGEMSLLGCKISELSSSSQITAPSGIRVTALGNTQTALSFSGAGTFLNARAGGFTQNAGDYVTNNGDITTDLGNLFAGTTTVLPSFSNTTGANINSAGVYSSSRENAEAIDVNRKSSDGAIAAWRREGTTVGSVSVTGTTTTYNTTSDYRLKENDSPLLGALDRLGELKPYRFNFISDPKTRIDGFFAHEVASVVPEAVTGEKDATDADGNPVIQVMDASKLIPLIVAAIQELSNEVKNVG